MYRSGDNERVPEGEADRILAGWFCFVQTEDGKVVAVNHDSNETADIINFKKSIAASFQTNFKRTEQEEEVDPQSDHISHYRYRISFAYFANRCPFAKLKFPR